MHEKPVVLVYKTRGRSHKPLEEACENHKFNIHVLETEDKLRSELLTGKAACIIVPLTPDSPKSDKMTIEANPVSQGTKEAIEFVNITGSYLLPEDSDIDIIYSTESDTPSGWDIIPDPRKIRGYHDYTLPILFTRDIGWQKTIEKLPQLKNKNKYTRNRHQTTVKVEFLVKDKVDQRLLEYKKTAFPSEVEFLLRAAFKDMSRIVLHLSKQGLSGSMGYIVEPFSIHGTQIKKYFAKVFPDKEKAHEEYKNFRDYVFTPFPGRYCPHYDFQRRYVGKGYSLLVMELVEFSGKSITLKDMILSSEFSVEQVANFCLEALSVMNKYWVRLPTREPVDLVDVYLNSTLKKNKRRIKLESENSCFDWFGRCADCSPFEDKLRFSVPKDQLMSSNIRICHGDLHLDNFMVAEYGGKPSPVFIDFSETGKTHSLKDLVTMESDLIIRGMIGIQKLSEKENVKSFLTALRYENDSTIDIEQWVTSPADKAQLEKLVTVINILRADARSFHAVSEREYVTAGMLKTLAVLSYGMLPRAQSIRATTYVTYLLERLKAAS